MFREAITLKEMEFYKTKKNVNRAGGSAGFHKTFFSFQKMEKTDKKRLHKAPTGRAGQHFMIFVFIKYRFF